MIEELSFGRKLLEESLTLAEKIGTKFWLAWQKTALADCLFRLGEIEAGSTLCQEAISLGEETKDKYVIAFAKRTFAEMLCSPELIDPEKSDLMIHSAINILQEIDAKPEIARSYMSYANILAGKGVKDMAQKYLTKAMGMFQNMSMTWDLAQLNQLQHKFRMS